MVSDPVIYLSRASHSPAHLLAGVWPQPVFQKPISSTMRQLYEIHQWEQRTRPSLEGTCSVLCTTVSELSSVFIVVDALDEYPEEQRDTLLHCLSALGPTVNLMFTSRPINVEHHSKQASNPEDRGERSRTSSIYCCDDSQALSTFKTYQELPKFARRNRENNYIYIAQRRNVSNSNRTIK